jgi:drug/metabolite transporter (DMT)-like permease
VISVAFLHESLTAAGWIGALAVSAAILLASGVEFRSKSLSVAVNQPGRVKDA